MSLYWAPKGSYSLKNGIKFCIQVPVQPLLYFHKVTKSSHWMIIQPIVTFQLRKRWKRDYLETDIFLDTDLRHDLNSYQQRESLLMIKKLRSNPNKIFA